MKNEELLKALIAELMDLDTLHKEYKDENSHYVIDSQKEGNTLTIKVTLEENTDKKEFVNWLQLVDDSILGEVLDELSEKEGLKNLDEIYNSEDYQKVIERVKSKTLEIVSRKIKMLQRLLN